MDIAFVNGQFIAKQDATVSIMDRGFLFGDSVYEVIPYFNQSPVGLKEHLQRLNESLRHLNIRNPYTSDQWQALFNDLIKQNCLAHTSQFMLYCHVTRGAEKKRQHAISDNHQPCVVLFCASIKNFSNYQLQGAKAITYPDQRHQLGHIKSTNLLANVLALHAAQTNGALEAILYRDDQVIECTSSNLFIVKNNQLITPPQGTLMLPGITRHLVIHQAKQLNICVLEQTISLNELEQADEIWITSSTKSLIPITQLNDKIISNGKPGKIGKQCQQHYFNIYSIATLGEKNDSRIL